MGRGGESMEKRRIQKQRQEKKAAKRDQRAERAGEEKEPVDEAELMERFRLLNERRADALVDDETFEKERHAIFVALGLEEATDHDDEHEEDDD